MTTPRDAVGDGVGDGRFHRGRAGAGRRERQRLAVGAEHALQRGAHIVEQRNEIGIEMAEDGRGHRAHHARRDQARAGAEQNAFS